MKLQHFMHHHYFQMFASFPNYHHWKFKFFTTRQVLFKLFLSFPAIASLVPDSAPAPLQVCSQPLLIIHPFLTDLECHLHSMNEWHSFDRQQCSYTWFSQCRVEGTLSFIEQMFNSVLESKVDLFHFSTSSSDQGFMFFFFFFKPIYIPVVFSPDCRSVLVRDLGRDYEVPRGTQGAFQVAQW